jgi:hypothetical protein
MTKRKRNRDVGELPDATRTEPQKRPHSEKEKKKSILTKFHEVIESLGYTEPDQLWASIEKKMEKVGDVKVKVNPEEANPRGPKTPKYTQRYNFLPQMALIRARIERCYDASFPESYATLVTLDEGQISYPATEHHAGAPSAQDIAEILLGKNPYEDGRQLRRTSILKAKLFSGIRNDIMQVFSGGPPADSLDHQEWMCSVKLFAATLKAQLLRLFAPEDWIEESRNATEVDLHEIEDSSLGEFSELLRDEQFLEEQHAMMRQYERQQTHAAMPTADEIDPVVLHELMATGVDLSNSVVQPARPSNQTGGAQGGALQGGPDAQQDLSYEALVDLEDVPTPLPKPLLDRLPRSIFKASLPAPQGFHDVSSPRPTCPICLTDYAVGDEVITLPDCFHEFHLDCVTEWFKGKKHCCLCKVAVGTHCQ